MFIALHVKYLLFFSDFNEILPIDRFFKNSLISNLMKIYPLGAELFHVDRQT